MSSLSIHVLSTPSANRSSTYVIAFYPQNNRSRWQHRPNSLLPIHFPTPCFPELGLGVYSLVALRNPATVPNLLACWQMGDVWPKRLSNYSTLVFTQNFKPVIIPFHR